MTTAQAASILRVVVGTVNRYEREGRLTAAIKTSPGIRGANVFYRRDVDTLAAELEQHRCDQCGSVLRRQPVAS